MRQKFAYLVVLILLLSSTLYSQFYFGKNKIQYSQFNWKILTTTHFKIYFYDEETQIAQIAAAAAEASYAFLSDKFNHHVSKKTPLIIYSAPTFFMQTNVISSLLPENVGGFTEFFKGRMVVPFNGSIADFRRVIRHELVHVFTFSKIMATVSEHRKTAFYGPPLWFTEGLAEYWSREWQSEADMVMVDMTLEGNLSTLDNLGYLYNTFFMYKYGESFCHFVADYYGEDKLFKLFDNWWKAKNFHSLFKLTVGKSLKEVSEDWVYHLKKEYYPRLENSDFPAEVSEAISPGVFAVSVLPLRVEFRGADDWVVYKANKLGYSGIYMRSPSTNKELTLIKGERSPDFESLHLLESRMGVSGDGRLAFISKRYEKDVIYVYDVLEQSIVASYEFRHLFHLMSPTWSPDNNRIVFSGATRKGIYDIFSFDLKDSTLTQLTNDIYYDTEPAVTPDGDIVFASDRGSFGYEGYSNLFIYSAVENTVTPLTYGRFHDSAPRYTEWGLLFTSDRQGSSNIFLLTEIGEVKQVTSFVTGAFDPSVRGDKLFFTAFQDFSYSVYAQTIDSSQFEVIPTEPVAFTAWNPDCLVGKYEEGIVDYNSDYSLDIAQSAIAYDALGSAIGGFQTVISDMLGNQMYYILISNTASSKDDFIESFNVGVTYINRGRRVNYGWGIYHLADEYFDDYDGLFSERQSGVIGLLSYPISKFTRVETSLFARHSYKKLFLFERERHAILATNYLSFVHDNSLWDVSGPIDGMRYNLTVGLTTDFYSGRSFNRLAFVDFRNYLRLAKYSALATRLFGFTSAGEEPQRIYLGGSWSLRGYSRKAFYGRNVVLISNELRFPLIDNLYIGFPFGRLGFQAIRGALFVDAGSAWNDRFDRMYGSVGVGARVSLGYFIVLRFDLAKRTDFSSLEDGVDFDFFFGWNF